MVVLALRLEVANSLRLVRVIGRIAGLSLALGPVLGVRGRVNSVRG